MNLVTTVLAFLLALGVLIIIHELGHYAVARLCGVRVLRFSVGFGRPLLRWQRSPQDTEWVVAAVPYGGYVRMLDERDPDQAPIAAELLPQSFSRQSVWRRIAIVSAGPLANLVFAVLLYTFINVVGVPEVRPVLGAPAAATVAARAGVADGDLVLALAGRAVRSWTELRWGLIEAAQEPSVVPLSVRGLDGVEHELPLDLGGADASQVDETWFERLGFTHGAGAPVVRGLGPGEPAERAGMRVGDTILAVDGVPVRTATEVARLVRGSTAALLALDLQRDGARLHIELSPVAVKAEDGTSYRRIGVDFREVVLVRFGPREAFGQAVRKTWDTARFSLLMLGRMVQGRASWKNLSGPVTIADVAGQTARMGSIAYLSFIALVSISLGVLNLLPIPVLDGGHLLYYAIEIVKGSPPSERAVELAQRFGIGLLVLLTVLALYNDLTRLLL